MTLNFAGGLGVMRSSNTLCCRKVSKAAALDPQVEALRKKFEALSPFCLVLDASESTLEGRFSASRLREIADAMDRLMALETERPGVV